MTRTKLDVAADLSWSRDVRAAVRRLDPTQRRIIGMIYFERRTQEQIADELELPRSTVARSASAGLQTLTALILGAGLAVE